MSEDYSLYSLKGLNMQNGEVKVSVICTCYNKGKWIRQSLDSVVRQKVDFDYEVLVVDDASTDESLLVIDEFRREHPDLVRVIAHEENQGISSTWLEACQQARGTYIARIDGDDYWTDELKLADQLRLLESASDSGWSSTDFDIVDATGGVICADALKSGAIVTVDSYEQMLAIKGLTNSSTWLVDAQLMRQANESLSPDDADDTFSIQLELFKRTRLVRVERSQCAMRVNRGSDSRPMSLEQAIERFEGLQCQQLRYLEKYKDIDYLALARHLIEQDTQKDIAVFERDRKIEYLTAQLAEQSDRVSQLEADCGLRPLQQAKSAARAMIDRLGNRNS